MYINPIEHTCVDSSTIQERWVFTHAGIEGFEHKTRTT